MQLFPIDDAKHTLNASQENMKKKIIINSQRCNDRNRIGVHERRWKGEKETHRAVLIRLLFVQWIIFVFTEYTNGWKRLENQRNILMHVASWANEQEK